MEATRSIRIAMHQMNYVTGDFEGNFQKTADSIRSAEADIHVLPECAVTNYASDDYFLDAGYQAQTVVYCNKYKDLSKSLNTTIVVGTPLRGKRFGRKMCNGLVVYQKGYEVHSYMKTHLPNYDVFDDVRWFESRLEQVGKDRELAIMPFKVDGKLVWLGFCICEDIWFDDVTSKLKELGAEVLISINSSPYAIAKGNFRRKVFADRVAETGLPLVYVNQVGGNDELVWDGSSAVLDTDGVLYEMGQGFEGAEVVTLVDSGDGFKNSTSKPPVALNDQQERYLMAALGLRDYIEKNGFAEVCFGLSGGADSTLVAALTVDVFGARRVNTLMMPSPYSSEESVTRSESLARGMGGGFSAKFNPITNEYEAAINQFRQTHGREPSRLAQENLQAQIRGNTLSAMSNDHGSMALIGTSNKSEILMGFGTLYGDLRGAFNPCKDLYKSIDVYPMLQMRRAEAVSADPTFAAVWEQAFGKPLAPYTSEAIDTLAEIIEAEPSAELWHDQKDTDSLPPYSRLDPVLWEIEDARVSQTDEEIAELLGEPIDFVRTIRARRKKPEYKRFQSAPGVKIHRKSPTTKDRRLPMTSKYS